MKARQILFISLLSCAALAGCGGNSSSDNGSGSSDVTPADPEIQSVINSLKGVSHTAHVNYDIYVNQVDADAIDGYVGNVSDRTFSYSEDGDRAYRIKSTLYFADLDKGTHDFVKDSEGNDIITTYDNGDNLYFRDPETGVIIAEYLEATNEVSTYIQSDYDYTEGIYIPVIFDEEFRNPFDYIQPRDMSKTGENTYTLTLDKAAFALECYGSVAAIAVEGCTITADSNHQITSMHFDMGIEGGEGYTYTRTTSFDITYSDVGEKSHLSHVTPCTNVNPKLETAFKAFEGYTSYKYSKDYVDEDGNVTDHIMAYVTPEAAFYHHDDDEDDTSVYSVGDDYDYIAALCHANGKYYGFEYDYNEYTDSWVPALVMLSTSAAYSIDSFLGLGPKYNLVSPAIFTKKEGTDDTYIVENDKLRKGIAAYFDLQFLGVNSQVLETRTEKFELTLEEDGSMTIDTGYAYSEYGYVARQHIVYHLYADSVNNTELPSYLTVPDTTGCEEY